MADHHAVIFYALRMTTCVWILCIDCCCQHADRTHKQFFVFASSSLQAKNVLLDFIGHVIEGVRQLLNFIASLHFNFLIEVLIAANIQRMLCELLNWLSNPSRK